ncbi:hypothetical protein M011DRAFT_42817 [Sporormia fimetaria CBS 119925]|uniref:Uncharacterized protein n=1 Tax=Sporormia fimetaria CBS 119925 TaxID=1340428 RepID=A0A6A6VDD2_9PLEO|nr:hypothetical protein M011DRAFT_42817 [Sporormia fimetaria CBS 119925]
MDILDPTDDRDSGRRKGPVCGEDNCRSKYYEEGDDGYLYCQNGHRKGTLVIGDDENDFSGPARRTVTRKRKEEDFGKQQQYYKGREALTLYLQSLQLILRHQIHFLVHTKSLPEDLEPIIHDLWTLRILSLEPKIATSQEYSSDSQTHDVSDTETSDTGNPLRPRLREKKLSRTPGLMDALALCYLGCLTLRLPITPGDFYTWTSHEQMPYKRAIRLLPRNMRNKLPASYHASLDPTTLLRFERFYTTVTDVSFALQQTYGIPWPPLNHPPLLLRMLQELALPLEIYDATVRIARILGFDFAISFPDHQGRKERSKRLSLHHIPEAQLLSALIVSVKLFYPFSCSSSLTKPIHPRTASEPSALTIPWRDWSHKLSSGIQGAETSTARAPYSIENLENLDEKAVFDMDVWQLDQFLDFYQDSFISTDPVDQRDTYRTALYELFPLDAIPAASSSPDTRKPGGRAEKEMLEVVKAVHKGFGVQKVVKGKDGGVDVRRAGEEYESWKRVEEVPEDARVFFERAARVVGMEVGMVVLGVWMTERGLEKWVRRKREGGRMEEGV